MAQEGRKVKPILPTTPSRSTDRKTSRTHLTCLKPAEDFFFFNPFPLNSFFLSVLLSFFIPSSFHPLPFLFLLPAFFYSFVLTFVKITSYLASDLSLFPLPSFLSYSIPFFPPSLLFFFPPIPLFPTGEKRKPGVLKTPELDRVTRINVSSRPVSTGD